MICAQNPTVGLDFYAIQYQVKLIYDDRYHNVITSGLGLSRDVKMFYILCSGHKGYTHL